MVLVHSVLIWNQQVSSLMARHHSGGICQAHCLLQEQMLLSLFAILIDIAHILSLWDTLLTSQYLTLLVNL